LPDGKVSVEIGSIQDTVQTVRQEYYSALTQETEILRGFRYVKLGTRILPRLKYVLPDDFLERLLQAEEYYQNIRGAEYKLLFLNSVSLAVSSLVSEVEEGFYVVGLLPMERLEKVEETVGHIGYRIPANKEELQKDLEEERKLHEQRVQAGKTSAGK
jgi:hypothetical protein